MIQKLSNNDLDFVGRVSVPQQMAKTRRFGMVDMQEVAGSSPAIFIHEKVRVSAIYTHFF